MWGAGGNPSAASFPGLPAAIDLPRARMSDVSCGSKSSPSQRQINLGHWVPSRKQLVFSSPLHRWAAH